jgi:lysyl-tRNA synthetase class II
LGRQVGILAQDEARLLKHKHTDTEHAFLGLLRAGEGDRDFPLRGRMASLIHRYLDERAFVEIEAPVVQPRYGGLQWS